MKEYNKLRIKYCKSCPIKQCNTCQIGHQIEALTKEREFEERKKMEEVQEKVSLMRQGIEELAAQYGLELIDAGYLTVSYKDRIYSLSTNKKI